MLNLEPQERVQASKLFRNEHVTEDELKGICQKILNSVERVLNRKSGLELVQIGKSIIFFKDE